MLSDRDVTTEKIVFKSAQHPVGKGLLQWCDEIEEAFTESFMVIEEEYPRGLSEGGDVCAKS